MRLSSLVGADWCFWPSIVLHNVVIGVAGVKRWEEERDQVNVYFEELSTKRQCVAFLVVQEIQVENPLPAIIRIYDYYQQELSVSTVSSCWLSVLTLNIRCIWEIMSEFVSHVHAWIRCFPVKFRIVLHLAVFIVNRDYDTMHIETTCWHLLDCPHVRFVEAGKCRSWVNRTVKFVFIITNY